MCGIIAINGNNTQKITDTLAGEMLSCLDKRGPDDRGFVRLNKDGNQTILGQTRLSIVDPVGGHQPMRDNKHPYTIVFNGEIYGYQETRQNLEKLGHIFSTQSDTEVILKAYAEYGEKCVDCLDGMFAFAIWDGLKQQLFIARDRFGKKPFYYAWINNDTFLGASEIKALFASGQIKGQVDSEALDDYLRLMYIPPWKTVYSNIHTLPPAHVGIVKDGQLRSWQYWQIDQPPKTRKSISYDVAKKEVKRLFDEAVRKRMIADVEIGSLLSGGVDSTLVTAYAQKYASHPLKTFSIGYEGHINELPFAKQASEKIGTDHHTLQATSDLVTGLKEVTTYMDEPHADSSDFPQHIISQLAASKVKVALSGDGADELFMGYGWYWKYWNTRKIVRLKNLLFSNQFKEHLKNVEVFSKTDRAALWQDTSLAKNRVEKECSSQTKSINLFDLTTYLPGQLLTKVDRTSMMHSLEIRSPFLDYKLAEFVYNLPEEYKMDKKSGKIILKDILTEIMPRDFVYRRKQGFGAPIKEWLRSKSVRKFVVETLGEKSQNPEIDKLFKKEKILAILEDFYEKQDDGVRYKIWSLLCLALWFQSHRKYHEKQN